MQLFRILRRKPSRMEIGTDFLQGRRSPVVSGKQLVRNLTPFEASRTMDFFIFFSRMIIFILLRHCV